MHVTSRSQQSKITFVSSNGSTITTEREQADRWLEHFCEVLDHPQPDEPANPHQRQMTPTSTQSNAIKAVKSGKDPGIDSIRAEMLKADLRTATWLNCSSPFRTKTSDWAKELRKATFKYVTTGDESHSCPSPAKVSVESLEESRQLLTRSWGKNKRDSGREENARIRSLHWETS